jgi:putative ABC transport system ATP-binding protein
MNASPLLSGRGLSKRYPMGAQTVEALRGVDIDVFPGDFLALRGPSGSGKTTLINLLGLLDRADAGTLLLDGHDTATLSENARADTRRDRFGFVFQTFNLIPVLTAAENVSYPMLLKPEPPRNVNERARELLAAVGLTGKENVRPDLLSGGQRQRVAIARALANHAVVIFADEPTASLDSHTADTILELMHELNRTRDVAFVISTHDARVVERAERVITLHDGEIATGVAA